jgi:hypothetical protein
MTPEVCQTVPLRSGLMHNARGTGGVFIAVLLVQACAQGKSARDAGANARAHPDAGAESDSGTQKVAGDAAVQRDADQQNCVLDSSYTLDAGHGVNPKRETIRLSPSGDIIFERYDNYGTKLLESCAASLPACGDPKLIDGVDLQKDFSAADVQNALAAARTQFFGHLASDGPVLTVTRGDGHTLGLDLSDGRDCSPASASCNPMPEAIKSLLADLEALSAWVPSTCAQHDASVDAGDADGG